ncbi:uncharacterized protein [Miscanthus floridulus]|uniref:uncharacterized protein n=1 Tax=Miscanthus floridulus TaxID=154761 RepID=UPI0034583441
MRSVRALPDGILGKPAISLKSEGIGDGGEEEAVPVEECRGGSAKGAGKRHSPYRRRRRELRRARMDSEDSSTARSPIRHRRRRFRMRVHVFERLVKTFEGADSYFKQKEDAIGHLRFSGLQKAVAAIHILAYGLPVDAVDEYVYIGSYNDINVLQKSPVFSAYLKGQATPVSFTINGHTYDMGYCLVDGPATLKHTEMNLMGRKRLIS